MDADVSTYPDLSADEPTTLTQFLDHYRRRAAHRLSDLSDAQSATEPLAATRLTAGGIVKHLAHMEDHWFTARLGGGPLPEPWRSAPLETCSDWDFSSAAADTVTDLLELYRSACDRSRAVLDGLADLDATAPRPSFGKGPVSARWVLVHLLEETASHVGHLDLITDELRRQASTQ